LILVLKAKDQIHRFGSVLPAVCDSVLIAVAKNRFLALHALMATNMMRQAISALKVALSNSSTHSADNA